MIKGESGFRHPHVTATLQADIDPATMSIAVEAASRAQLHEHEFGYQGVPVQRLTEPLRLLAAVWGAARADDPFLDEFLTYRNHGIVRSGPSTDQMGAVAALANAFAKDDDELLAGAVSHIPDRVLRRATTSLSPLEEDGLTSWYWLQRLSEIDDLFLFFRKATFLAGSGLTAAETNAP